MRKGLSAFLGQFSASLMGKATAEMNRVLKK